MRGEDAKADAGSNGGDVVVTDSRIDRFEQRLHEDGLLDGPCEYVQAQQPTSWRTSRREPNEDLRWYREQNHKAFMRTVREAIGWAVLIIVVFLGIWTWDSWDLNHGLGYGGKARDREVTSWVGEPAPVVQPVVHRRSR